MKISTKWFTNTGTPSFNVDLHSAEDKPAFLTIRGCKIVAGKDGEFVSYPAHKNENTGKWWNHVTASDAFNADVLVSAKASRPASAPEKSQAPVKSDW